MAASRRFSEPLRLRSLVTSRLTSLLICCLAVGWFGDLDARAERADDEPAEFDVKAICLCAFGRYVTWPDVAFESADSPFVIGVYGGNPFGDALHRLTAKTAVRKRAIQVRQIDSPQQCVHCQILFVTRSVSRKAETQILQLTAGKPILLVGESPGFANRGGTVNFYPSHGYVRFELNPDRGVESQLTLNAKLLMLGAKASSITQH